MLTQHTTCSASLRVQGAVGTLCLPVPRQSISAKNLPLCGYFFLLCLGQERQGRVHNQVRQGTLYLSLNTGKEILLVWQPLQLWVYPGLLTCAGLFASCGTCCRKAKSSCPEAAGWVNDLPSRKHPSLPWRWLFFWFAVTHFSKKQYCQRVRI